MKATNVLNKLNVANVKALFTKVALIGFAAGGALLITPAKANAQVAFGFRVGHARVGVYAPGPAYYAPAPAYYAPAPEYYQVQPRYAVPAYGYANGNGYYRHEEWEREHRDFDRHDFNQDRRDLDRHDFDHHDFERHDFEHHDFDHQDERRDDHRDWERH